MSSVPKFVTFRRYIDNDSGSYLVADILRPYGVGPEEWNEWEEKLISAIGYETTLLVTWDTETNEVTFQKE